jgi:hypothetical protein
MKPLGVKAYGSIPHLSGSRLGPGDHHCHEGQSKIATLKVRDRHDLVIVQEKLDGSCCAVAKLDGKTLALGRAGYLAESSEYSVHHAFSLYVKENEQRFAELLSEGERVVGEFLAQAVGTRYQLPHEPFVPFDIIYKQRRIVYKSFEQRVKLFGFTVPYLLHVGGSLSIQSAIEKIQVSGHGAIDPVEGAIWRIERKNEVDFITKFVRHDKEDGKYFPEKNNDIITWNCNKYIPMVSA